MTAYSNLSPVEPRVVRRRLGRALAHRRRLRLGLVQAVYSAVALILALLLPELETGDFTVDSGRLANVMIGVGSGVLAFTGLVYSLLFLVVQFGTTTYSPRLNLFRDAPIVWHAFSFFVAVFIFCFVAPFMFGGEDVTTIVVIFLVISLFVTLALFRLLQQTAFAFIQLASVLDQAEARGRDVIAGVYPEMAADGKGEGVRTFEPPGETVNVYHPDHAMILQTIDVPRLTRVAEAHDVVVECVAGIGDTLSEGEIVARVHGTSMTSLRGEILRTFGIGAERTFEQDPGLALRVLVDIGARALSAAINDPTTAVQALDHVDSLMRFLSAREMDIERVEDAGGRLRVILKLPTWEEYVGLAFDEFLFYGKDSPQVIRRLVVVLDRLAAHVPAERRPAVDVRLSAALAFSQASGRVGAIPWSAEAAARMSTTD
jgi:uncharacterized membrane protein